MPITRLTRVVSRATAFPVKGVRRDTGRSRLWRISNYTGLFCFAYSSTGYSWDDLDVMRTPPLSLQLFRVLESIVPFLCVACCVSIHHSAALKLCVLLCRFAPSSLCRTRADAIRRTTWSRRRICGKWFLGILRKITAGSGRTIFLTSR